MLYVQPAKSGQFCIEYIHSLLDVEYRLSAFYKVWQAAQLACTGNLIAWNLDVRALESVDNMI